MEWSEATDLRRGLRPRTFRVEKKGDLYRKEGGRSRDLVVYVHGFFGKPRRAGPTMDAIWEEYPDADVLAPPLPFGLRPRKPGGVPYRAWPYVIVANLVLLVDQAWNERRGGYDRVLIIGSSMGGVFARKLYVIACGELDEAPFEEPIKERLRQAGGVAEHAELIEPRPWAAHVERVVLLASMNRGWTISHHLSIAAGIGAWLGWGLTRFLIRPIFRREPVAAAVKRGAPMITQLRIQSLRLQRRAVERGVGGALTVQLLGTIDDLVSPDDSIDLVTGSDFYYLEVPRSGHEDVAALPGRAPKRPGEPDPRPARVRAFRDAISLTAEELARHEHLVTAREYTLAEDPHVEHVVFVIHGIRDQGYWTRKVYNRIERAWPGSEKTIISETASYGYFPILSFILPSRRREKVEWLMDQYTESLARYPNAATFSYVGHSNGTYLLAKALEQYPACRFHRVVFAGSVVRRNYPWHARRGREQVQEVLNLVAKRDLVVALFPGALESVGVDLGSAGHRGFDEVGSDYVTELSEVSAGRAYLAGGHGAGIAEGVWPTITDFVVNGTVVAPDDAELAAGQPSWVLRAPWVWGAWLAIGLTLAAIGFLLVAVLGTVEVPVVLVAYLFVVWKLLTRL